MTKAELEAYDAMLASREGWMARAQLAESRLEKLQTTAKELVAAFIATNY